jgi:hypothetical protein
MPITQKNVLNDVEAARYLGLAPQSLRNLRHYGRGPAYHKLGSRVVYKLSDLDKYLAERRIDPERRGAAE